MQLKASATLLCVFLLLSAVVAETFDLSALKEIKDEVVKETKECLKQTNTKVTNLLKLYKAITTKKDNVEKNSKCFVSCVMKKLNVMDDKGDFDISLMKSMSELIPSDPVKALVLENLEPLAKESSNSNDACERGFTFVSTGYKKLSTNPQVLELVDQAKTIVGEMASSIMSQMMGGR